MPNYCTDIPPRHVGPSCLQILMAAVGAATPGSVTDSASCPASGAPASKVRNEWLQTFNTTTEKRAATPTGAFAGAEVGMATTTTTTTTTMLPVVATPFTWRSFCKGDMHLGQWNGNDNGMLMMPSGGAA